jgi:Tfp pilus assembly protein PilO
MDLKNLSVDDIKAKLQAVDKKTYIKFGIGFGAIILFLIIYYAILNPIVNEKKAQHQDKILKENEILEMNNEIITMKTRIKKITPEYENSSALFHSKAEVEDLYSSLSKFAAVNGLVISKIEKQKPKPVSKDGTIIEDLAELELGSISYYKIPVEYEITGNFLGYIKFKRDISKSKKMLNFDKEMISVVQESTTGAIIATGNLTIVGLPDEFF